MAKQKNKSKQEPELTIHDIRKQQADQALALARTLDPASYVGNLNDAYYYVVIRTAHMVHDVKGVLADHGIESVHEHRDLTDDDILLLKDAEPKTGSGDPGDD